jgi:hypothetical protein
MTRRQRCSKPQAEQVHDETSINASKTGKETAAIRKAGVKWHSLVLSLHLLLFFMRFGGGYMMRLTRATGRTS